MGIKRLISFIMINTLVLFNIDNTYEKIIKYNDMILRFNPEFEYSWYRKGLAFSYLGKFGEALCCYDKIISLKPSSVSAIKYKGDVFTELGQYEKALKCFDECLKIDPKNCRVLLSKAICYSSFEDYSNAIETLDLILENYSDSRIVLLNKALVLIDYGNREEAFDLLNLIVSTDIDFEDPFVRNYSRNEAIDFLESRKADAYFTKGLMEWKDDNLDDAIESKLEGLKIIPNDFMEIGSVGALYYEKKDYENAEYYLLKSLSLKPNFEQGLYFLGRTYQKQGMDKEAIANFKKVLEINHNCERASNELINLENKL